MIRYLFILMLCVSVAGAQTKGKQTGNKGKGKGKAVATSDSTKVEEEEEMDPMQALELTLPLEVEIDGLTGEKKFYKDRKIKNDSIRAAFRAEQKRKQMTFYVRTKKPKKATDRMELCINIANRDTFLTYCYKDSVVKDPEVSKLLYNKTVGDTVYMLIYVDAFTKSAYRGGACNGGHETKVYFVRWAPKGKAIWKQRTISSCIKTITNMTKIKIPDWDGSAPLELSYHKGSQFYDIKFDPAAPQLGLQSEKSD